MQSPRRTVIGVFDEAGMADQAVSALENAGFNSAQIHRHGHQATGGFLSGLRNLFTGDSDTDTARADDFTDLGLSKDESDYYESESQAGHHIVSVRADGREEEAMSILRENGAYNYGTRSGGSGLASTGTTTTDNARAYDNTGVDATGLRRPADYDNTAANTTYNNTTANATDYDTTRTAGTVDATGRDYADTDETRRMRLREEQLNVDKNRVQAGEVGLHKDVISEEKAIDVPVTHEEAYIERRPVTDASVTDNTPIGEGETIRVPLSEEQVNVNKNTVVTGEVEVGKRAVTENQRVSDSVRREEARMDNDGNARVTGDAGLNRTTEDRVNTERTDDRNL